jgi:NACHT domain
MRYVPFSASVISFSRESPGTTKSGNTMTTNNSNKVGQLTLHRDNFNLAAISQSSDALNEVSQRIISALVKNRGLFESSMQDQAKTINELHAENTSSIIQEHEKTRTILLDAVCKVGSGRRNAEAAQNDQWNGQEEDLVIRRRAEDRIICSLRIPALSEHCTRIAKAHVTTFQWTFWDPTSEDRPLSEFARWLKSGDGVYWVNGKAGSGKSTFMRYICEHPETKVFLRDWCGDLPLAVASFFFCSGGTADQKSQAGLLRSLLHQLLYRHRSLIPTVLPFQWEDEYIVPVNPKQELFWDRDILRRAFDILRTQNQIRMCLFIDGLDEYEGEKDGSYDDIVSFFIGLADCANIKICVSSRPWPVFEYAFRSAPSLTLQDITHEDIFRYVNEKLNGHERMNDLQRIDPENTKKLIEEIVTKDSGVFLWVSLVVRSLLNGFTNNLHSCFRLFKPPIVKFMDFGPALYLC